MLHWILAGKAWTGLKTKQNQDLNCLAEYKTNYRLFPICRFTWYEWIIAELKTTNNSKILLKIIIDLDVQNDITENSF